MNARSTDSRIFLFYPHRSIALPAGPIFLVIHETDTLVMSQGSSRREGPKNRMKRRKRNVEQPATMSSECSQSVASPCEWKSGIIGKNKKPREHSTLHHSRPTASSVHRANENGVKTRIRTTADESRTTTVRRRCIAARCVLIAFEARLRSVMIHPVGSMFDNRGLRRGTGKKGERDRGRGSEGGREG